MSQLFRVVNHRSKSTSNTTDWASEIHRQPLDALPDTRKLTYTTVSCRATGSESQAVAHLHERDVLKQVCHFLPLCIHHLLQWN